MSVIQLSTRRPAAASDDLGYVACECGSAWFELCTIDADGTKNHGVVALNEEGSVTGYSGTPHCAQCGREKLP